MTMPGFTAENSLYRGETQYVTSQGIEQAAGGPVVPAGLFRWCEGWPPTCCTCDLTNGGCDCSRTHTEM
jgi:hypothetical protein